MSTNEWSGTRRIAGFGIPLLDLIADVDKQFLDKYDLDCNNSTQATDSQAGLYQDLLTLPGVQVIPGGAVPNALRIAQWILGVPGATISFGCIGNDDFGRLLTSKSESEGVCVQYQVHSSLPTGTCAVLITGPNRCLCANFAAAKQFSFELFQSQDSWKHVQTASCFYIVGYFIHTYPDISRHLAELASKEGKTLAINLSAVYVCKQSTSHMIKHIQYADIVFGNSTELEALAQSMEWDLSEKSEIMMKLSNHLQMSQNSSKVRHIVITDGPKPTLWFDGKTTRCFPVNNVPEDKIVDTCGAGDAFAGGFLVQLIQNKSVEDCIRCGHYAAGFSIQQRGMTITGSPDFR